MIFIIDDDTELDKSYVKVALDYFAKNPKVVSITGKISNQKVIEIKFIWQLLRVLLGLNGFNGNVSKSSQNNSFFRGKEQKMQWLLGCHTVYRCEIFDTGFQFNQYFIRWSFCEDVMLSYQVYKYYSKGSLMYIPEFKLIHHKSSEARLVNASIIRMKVIYRFIFWYKEIYRGSKLTLIYHLYYQLIFMIFSIIKTTNKLKLFKIFLQSYCYLIINNKVDYNAFILKSKNK